MQARTSFAALVLPVVLALSAVRTTDAFAAPPTNANIVVVSVRGDVQVTMAGAAREVRAGSVVTTPARIRTGRNGFIELRQGPTTASVASDSEIEIAASSSTDRLVERIVQTRGNVFYDVGKRTGRKLRVETAYLVAVIKGTQFNVSAEIDSATVSLFEGRLEIWTPDATDFVDLNAGEIAARKRTDSSIRVLSLETGETLRADAAKPAEAPAAGASTSTAASATEAGVATHALVTEQVVSRVEDPETRADTTSAVATPPAVAVAIDLLDESSSNGRGPSGEGPPGQDPLGNDSPGNGPSGEGPPGLDRLDGSPGNSANAPGHAVDVPAVVPDVDATVSAPAVDTTIVTTVTIDAPAPVVDAGVTAGPVDLGVGVDVGNAAATVDVGEATIATPALPVVPVVDEVVNPIRGLGTGGN